MPPKKTGPKPVVIDGVGPDTPSRVNEHGAATSDIPYRFDLIDPNVLLKLAGVYYSGAAKYGEDQWRTFPPEEHLNHAIVHLLAYLAGDEQDDHLDHALCRISMAASLDRNPFVPPEDTEAEAG